MLVYLYRVLAQSGLSLNDQLPGGSVSLGEALMAPTVIYVKQVSFQVLFPFHIIAINTVDLTRFFLLKNPSFSNRCLT
jgi:phosphoribosylaminoimidazole (AIR) synthetase